MVEGCWLVVLGKTNRLQSDFLCIGDSAATRVCYKQYVSIILVILIIALMLTFNRIPLGNWRC